VTLPPWRLVTVELSVSRHVTTELQTLSAHAVAFEEVDSSLPPHPAASVATSTVTTASVAFMP
jgi:hypothetical protein